MVKRPSVAPSHYRAFVLTLFWVTACNFGSGEVPGTGAMHGGSDGSGGGGGSSATDGPGSEGTGGATSTGTGPGVGSLTTPSTGDTTDTDGGAEDESSDTSTGGPIDACDMTPLPLFTQVITASESIVIAPMSKRAAPVPGGECVASEVADQGTANFLFSAPCTDEYFVWGHVWDSQPNLIKVAKPDSYDVAVDGGSSTEWAYGCQTFGTAAGWRWIPVEESAVCLDPDALRFTIDPGTHTINFHNREAGDFDQGSPPGEVAAIARILVTNDPTYVPTAGD